MLAGAELSGACVRNHRQRLGLTQAGLAEALGVTANTVARWERSVQRIAHPERVRAAIGRLEETRPTRADRQIHVAAETPRNNLPAPLNQFVGRQSELTELRRFLGTARLLTLTGAAGIGKTRLALELAAAVVGRYPDGVWLVELASIADADLAVPAIATAIGVADEFDRPLVETLERTLAARQLLLVLDNCEHLLAGITRLIRRLLRASPGLRVLTTSRETLGIAGETVWRVPPLATVRVGELPEAMRLFVARAQAATPEFALQDANETAVRQICARLDGMPLSIELAAATAVFLTPRQFLEHITAPTEWPDGTPADQAEWHQPMAATLQHSVNLLTEAERRLFAQLAVFSGGFSLAAADAIWNGPAVNLVRTLVLKSLVIAEPSPAGVMRYRLLEPLREFARGLLQQTVEAHATARTHAHYYLELSRAANLGLAHEAGGRWWPVLNQEHDNLHAAVRWFEQAGEPASAQLVGTAIAEVWRVRGHLGEARALLARFSATSQATKSTPGVLLLAGQLAYFQGDFGEALRLLEEAARRANQWGLWPGLARAYARLADVARARGDFGSARRRVHEALAACRDDADAFRASLHLREALIDLDELRIEAACAVAERCLPLVERGGFVRMEAEARLVLAVAASWRGQHARAVRLLEQSLANWQVGDRWGSARTLLELGRVTIAAGDVDGAATYIARSLKVCRDLGDPWGAAAAIEASAVLAAHARRQERAGRLLAAAAALRERGHIVQSPREYAWLVAHLDADRRAEWTTRYAAAAQASSGLSLAQAVELALREERRDHAPGLTQREREVARLVAAAKTNRQIAYELYIALPTVERHVTNILHKLQLSSRAQVVLWAAENRGLVRESSRFNDDAWPKDPADKYLPRDKNADPAGDHERHGSASPQVTPG